MANEQGLALVPYRVLDLSEGGVNWAGRVLADLGADVIKVEPPEGSATRLRGPVHRDVVDRERSLYWLAYCANKRGVTLDLATDSGRRQFIELVRTADVLIESFAPGQMQRLGLGYDDLRRVHPGLIYTSVTPYGSTGPYAHYKATDATLWAMGGATFLSGDPDRPPVRISAPQAELHAGAQAAAGSMVALWHRLHTGRGQHVDVSMQSAVLWTTFNAWAFPPMHKMNFVRGTIVRGTVKTVEQCQDGYVNVAISAGVAQGPSTARLVKWMAEEGAATEAMLKRDWPAWDVWEIHTRGGAELEELNDAKERARRWLLTKTKGELFERSLRDGIMLASCNNAKDVWEHRHLRERDYWVTLDHGELGAIALPGPYIRMSETPLQIRRRAPRLGEHNDEVLGALRAPVHPSLRLRSGQAIGSGLTEGGMPFDGLKVLDLSWVAVGPITTRYLADHGATVVRIETVSRADISRAIAPFKEARPGVNRGIFPSNVNANKLGLGLNLSKPEGRRLVERLLREWRPDVLLESFSPGVIARMGLDYVRVRVYRPDIVYMSTSQLGQTGPHAKFKGYGIHAAALAGFDQVTGWPDRGPEPPYGAYTDFINPPHGLAAIIAALDYRRRTGKGQYIDQSQLECALHYLAPVLLDYQVNGRVAMRRGNADPEYSPHGLYPCKEYDTFEGGGSWVAIAVTNADEWRALTRRIGRLDLANDASLASVAGRRAREAEIDAAIAAWTSGQTRHEAMRLLQEAGVPAGAVQKASDLWADPQLAHRKQFQWLEHPECGQMPYKATQFTLS
ncbi:MAG: CoA transferase [Chloroflexi bacterium]|nr:CoA transferase [Chloroflexota bacterium]